MGVSEFWQDKRVLVTGHTGFKGSWLAVWLHLLGAEVHGYALEPEESKNLFHQLNIQNDINHVVGDIRDEEAFFNFVTQSQPDVILHLAAQSLVRRSYYEPIYTWQTNVIGTCNLLNSLRDYKKECSVVIVTTDKVYENNKASKAFSEGDRLGGFDPYSSSKAAVELCVNSWRKSYFMDNDVDIATARAGNVIGGGDWSKDRIIPDLVNAIINKQSLNVRNPNSVRPWQHVLESLSGYLLLAKKLYENENDDLESAFNFGPESSDFRTVQELVEIAFQFWPGSWKNASMEDELHESEWLTLSNEKAKAQLSWRAKWDFKESVHQTIDWYKLFHEGKGARELILEQINRYMEE